MQTVAVYAQSNSMMLISRVGLVYACVAVGQMANNKQTDLWTSSAAYPNHAISQCAAKKLATDMHLNCCADEHT